MISGIDSLQILYELEDHLLYKIAEQEGIQLQKNMYYEDALLRDQLK